MPITEPPSGRAILVVDDDEHLSDLLQRHLTRAGFGVEIAASGERALTLIRAHEFDAVVLDLGLRGIGGIEVCQQLRKLGRTMPVLMLTARGDINARVAGLDAGADDYMVKPFALRELDARLRALLRREPSGVGAALEVGNLHCNLDERRVWRGDQEIHLSRTEFDLLVALMERPGMASQRGDLLERVWPENPDSESNLVDQYVRRLRDKVDRPFGEQSIETVRSIGYRIRRPAAVDA